MKERGVGYIYMGNNNYKFDFGIPYIMKPASLANLNCCVPNKSNPNLGKREPDAEIKAASRRINARFAFDRKDKKYGSELTSHDKH